MTVRKDERRGKLVIDLGYRAPNGKTARYRRDAQVQTLIAARAEERRLMALISLHGKPLEPSNTENNPTDPAVADGPPEKTFAEVVAEYRATYMISDLKVTTRRGYHSVLNGALLPRFGRLRISEVNGEAAGALDLDMSMRKVSRGTRNNVQAVLRSVLRFAVFRGYLDEAPSKMPRLRPVEPSILEIPTDAEVTTILTEAGEVQRRSFAIMAFAGLRPNEVRALRRRDLRLRRESGEPVGGFLSVREGRSYGETHTPKTGVREVPIAPALARLLGPLEEGPRDGHIAITERGDPWGQHGLDQAFGRVRKRARLEGWSVYCLRHYAITAWLRAGVPVHIVQKMAGHKHLSTTQRYVDYLKEDLEEAAKRMATIMR